MSRRCCAVKSCIILFEGMPSGLQNARSSALKTSYGYAVSRSCMCLKSDGRRFLYQAPATADPCSARPAEKARCLGGEAQQSRDSDSCNCFILVCFGGVSRTVRLFLRGRRSRMQSPMPALKAPSSSLAPTRVLSGSLRDPTSARGRQNLPHVACPACRTRHRPAGRRVRTHHHTPESPWDPRIAALARGKVPALRNLPGK